MLFPLTFAAAAEEASRRRPAFTWWIAIVGVFGFNLLHAVCLFDGERIADRRLETDESLARGSLRSPSR